MPAEALLLLREERDKRPDLARTLDLHLALLVARAELAPEIPEGWGERARARLARGETALGTGDLEIDPSALCALAARVCRIAAAHQPELAPDFQQIGAVLGEEGVALELAMRHFDARDAADLPSVELDPNLLDFVLNHALHPFLDAYRAAAAPWIEGHPEYRGRCPVCGGRPDLAALEGEAGGRRLLCSRCDAEWPYHRVGCPFCANEEAGSLGYFSAGEAHRLYVCDRCGGYLKTVDLRETWRRLPLAAERILTVGMDLAAARQGYAKTR
jgi:FdhE protein